MAYKILTYNVANGFHQFRHVTEEYDCTKPENNRLKLAQKLIKDEKPDFFCINEANFCAPSQYNIFMDYKKLFDYKYGYCTLFENQLGTCLLSKYPIEKAKTITFGVLGAIEAIININGKKLNIFLITFSPFITEKQRIKELWQFSNNIRELRKQGAPYIITGDLNSLSDEDVYDRKQLKQGIILALGKSKGKKLFKILWKRRFVSWLRETYKVRDAFEKKESRSFSYPTDLISENKSSAIRIDYCFVSPKIDVKEAKVIQNKLTQKASDHYPISVMFDVRE